MDYYLQQVKHLVLPNKAITRGSLLSSVDCHYTTVSCFITIYIDPHLTKYNCFSLLQDEDICKPMFLCNGAIPDTRS